MSENTLSRVDEESLTPLPPSKEGVGNRGEGVKNGA